MSKFLLRKFLLFFAVSGCMAMIEDDRVPAQDRMRYARWVRVLKRKHATGRGVCLIPTLEKTP